MRGRNWKTMLEYEIGVLLLIAVILFALFFPDWYNEWQKESSVGKVELSSREEIQFVDVASLDVAGRLKLLKDAEYLSYATLPYSPVKFQDTFQRCKKCLTAWEDCSVLPEGCTELLEEKYINEVLVLRLYVVKGAEVDILDENTLDVVLIQCIDHEGLNTLTVLADCTADMLYYVSACGENFGDGIAERLGPGKYASLEELYESYGKSGGTLELSIQRPGDFAAACGAKSAELSPYAEGFSRNIQLSFENFESMARIELVENGAVGGGMAVMFGTDYWVKLMSILAGESNADITGGTYVFIEYPVDLQAVLDQWCEENGYEITRTMEAAETEAMAESATMQKKK